MQLKQKTELRTGLVPQLAQSLNVLSLSSMEIQELIETKLESNPLLEEVRPKSELSGNTLPRPFRLRQNNEDFDFQESYITKKASLQDVLFRQLGCSTSTDEEFKIGQEIIGNINEHGYLAASLPDISKALNVPVENVEKVLKIVQEFEPAGVGARSVAECLRLQLKCAGEHDPLLIKIVECHLEDVAKKNYTLIAKSLKVPLETIEPLIKKIHGLDPKPGRNFCAEETQHITPDVIIKDNGKGLEISINNEDTSLLGINKEYREMLKNKGLDPATKEFLSNNLQDALELLRTIEKRCDTLRKVAELIVEIQPEAFLNDLSCLKPMTFREIADKLGIHESTVCRTVMNKYVKTPHGGAIALKEFFSSQIKAHNGESVSSAFVKRTIKELIELEDKKHPLSDQDIADTLNQKDLKVSRRTVAKYREELKLLSTTFRRER